MTQIPDGFPARRYEITQYCDWLRLLVNYPLALSLFGPHFTLQGVLFAKTRSSQRDEGNELHALLIFNTLLNSF